MNHPSVQQFFDTLAGEYAEKLDRCVPRYREMLWALLEYLPRDRQLRSILELGSGTGNLSCLLAERFPAAHIRFVDVSGDSLEICCARIGTDSRFVFDRADFRDLAFADDSFDLIVSSISIHHLRSSEKQTLFGNTHRWLAAGGVFAFADQCAGATDDLYQRHVEYWRQQAFDSGVTEEEWELWMQHQAEHDHHDPLPAQIDWLRNAGYSVVDCPWRYLLWAVVQARK